MKKLYSVSIGIPAYNEEANIDALLKSFLRQKEEGFYIKEIIVLSDGSQDLTGHKVRAVSDRRIRLIEDTRRRGKSYRVNQILRRFHSDILFLFDADIVVHDNRLLAKVIKKSHFSIDGVVAVNTMPLPAKTYFEKIVEAGVLVMKDIVDNWRNGRNYLAYRGSLLAIDGSLAKQMVLKESLVNNDAFIYFFAIAKGYAPRYLSNINVFYRSPHTFSDHMKQAVRYQSSYKELRKYFTLDLQKAYAIPFYIIILATVKYAASMPQFLLPYLFVNLLTRFARQDLIKSTWSISTSTKIAGA